MKCILKVLLFMVLLTSCKTEDLYLKKLELISTEKYYTTDIFADSTQNVYGVWKLTSTSGGFIGTGFKNDFDYLILKPNAIFGILRNDSLIGYGKITLLQNGTTFYNNSIHCQFDFDQITNIQLNTDPEKYISLTKNDTMNLIAPCCDRYNFHLVRQNSDLNSANLGTLKGKISIGPLCPEEPIPPQPGCQPTAETFKAWQTSVWNASKTILIKDINPDLSGKFSVHLSPGNYLIDFKSSQSHSFGGSSFPIHFSISKQNSTIVDVNIDTGIR
jgi:hypothetical protein